MVRGGEETKKVAQRDVGCDEFGSQVGALICGALRRGDLL